MMKLKKLTVYEPAVKESENIIYLRDEDGNDWYESQSSFSSDKLKIAYTSDGVIRTADYDISALWPLNMAVAEVTKESVPQDFNIDGEWMFDGKEIVPVPVDHIGKAEATRQRLLSLASQSIAPLQDAVDLGVSTEEEELLLKAWKIFRIEVNRINTSMAPNIEWPSKPS
ncbi:tail fiber assembly protein [Cronobacter sakazakii]|nr:tail fiber assembly protein [Cronobacter sakazakii]EIZ9234870.1 tail fiber assembly protein [Cronobacter sakazakii]ELQ6142617.1 tail fiber assembly protein [Cronobacter sakazakii]ELY2470857.1 tail fiber assembly protein [Cronobacter sakazakii]ELY2491884.1 tail fiber assembly protein [Cronobacter sakazakii]